MQKKTYWIKTILKKKENVLKKLGVCWQVKFVRKPAKNKYVSLLVYQKAPLLRNKLRLMSWNRRLIYLRNKLRSGSAKRAFLSNSVDQWTVR